MTLYRYGPRAAAKPVGPPDARAVPRGGVRAPRSAITAFALIASLAAIADSRAAILGDAELRSYLGEPLQVRIALTARDNEAIDVTCISLSRETQPSTILRDAQIELLPASDASGSRMMTLRSGANMNDAFVRIGLRYACADQAATRREYTLLLDPKPTIAVAVAPAPDAADAPRASPTPPRAPTTERPTLAPTAERTVGQWQTSPVDTLASIAEGIYPNSAARKKRYIAALRALNPILAGLSDDTPLPPGVLLTLPDLKALSVPERLVAPTAPAPAVARARNDAPTTAKPNQSVATESSAPPANRRPPVSSEPTGKSSTSGGLATPAPPPGRAAAQDKSAPPFSLRLSGSELDLSRSKKVTEAERALLRERQFFLDADDQLAQFLALKNAVKQLESRLKEMQAKGSNATATQATAPLPTNVPQRATTSQSGPPPNAAASSALPAPALSPSNRMASAAPMPAAKPANDLQGAIDEVENEVWIAIAASIFAFGSLAILWRQRRRKADTKQSQNVAAPRESADVGAAEDATEREAYRDHQEEADELALRLRAEARSRGVPNAAEPAFDKTMALDKPLVTDPAMLQESAPDDSPDRFDLDDSPATTVDFLIGDQPASYDEQRTRRLQYMRQRYPELLHNTISLDDPDTLINAARHYLEDSAAAVATGQHDLANIDKAAELLGFAVEERPQEMRYWLAQFEVFRIKGMNAQYAELGAKFNVLFSRTPEWLQVKAIGHELNPTSPLFALSPEEASDAAAINSRTGTQWLNQLNTPAADARRDLAALLRQSLVDVRAKARAARGAQ